MKKYTLFVFIITIFIVNLFAQTPYEVNVRFINASTGLDFTDISTIQFEVELDPPSGDIQIGPSSLCSVNLNDVGTGFQSSFVQLDLDNFTNVYQTDSNIRVKIWVTQNPNGFAEITYQKDIDIDPAGGFMGWSEWFGVGGDPLEVDPAFVILSSFAAAVFANEFVQISWVTQSESNNMGWNIYRNISNNIVQAVQINTLIIPGAGTTTEPTDYSYIDSYIVNNTTYWYWLESINIAGETNIHGPIVITVSIDDPPPILPTETKLHDIYPNPFN